MAKRKATKKRNPQDATRVNVRASKGRDEKLGERIDALSQRVGVLERQFKALRGGVVNVSISALQKAKKEKARGPRMASRTRF
jgi:N12 class adenine-specific DNA methylase